MAEIKIEKKKPLWPWILLIIIILALIAYFVYTNSETDDYPDDVNSEENNQIEDDIDDDMNDSIGYEDAVDFPDSNSASTRSNLEESKALEDLKNYSTEMDEMSDSRMPNTIEISNFKTVSSNLAIVLQSLQSSKYPNLQKEAADLKQTTHRLTTATTIEKQKSTLQHS